MSMVVLSEQHRHINFDRVATMRVCATAAAARAAVVKEGDLLSKADIQANPVKVSKALYTGLKTWLDSECFKMQEVKGVRHPDFDMRILVGVRHE
eukprot:3842762-Pyramimonas_sp.AAC.1